MHSPRDGRPKGKKPRPEPRLKVSMREASRREAIRRLDDSQPTPEPKRRPAPIWGIAAQLRERYLLFRAGWTGQDGSANDQSGPPLR